MAYTLVIAEKPSVARDIARVLGAKERGKGFFAGNGYRVTWAVGHLVALAEPQEIDPQWKKWRPETLPILPEQIPLKVLSRTKAQYACVKRLMNGKDCEGLICATDAGREGELIFRYLYRMAGCGKPVRRLWISSMTDEAVREGFASLRPGSDYDALYESARCRSEADWLVGMNASRAFTIRYGALLSIGRVQTPTLMLLVRRRQEIAAFNPVPFWTVTADFGGYTGLWLNEETKERRLYDPEKARVIAEKVRGKRAEVESVVREAKREGPPLLYDLTALQRDANRLLGFTAKKTLAVAQALYEEHKLLTYPRTDSRFLPRDMAGRVRAALAALPQPYESLAKPLLEKERLPMPRRVFDDGKVTDHHAIVPTGKRADVAKLPPDALALYDLVARRLLAVLYPDHLYDVVRVLTRAGGEPFESLGREVRQEGWKAVHRGAASPRSNREAEDVQILPALAEGEARQVRDALVKADQTKPPAPHTDASLLAAMERAGRELEDEELRQSMKQCGLGTPATRAATIERLLEVGYAERKGRAILATEKGARLISAVPPDIASPETTGRWEKALSDIASGGMEPGRFLSGIRRLAASLVESAANAPGDVAFEPEERKKGRRKSSPALGVSCPLCGKGRVMENSKAFYCARWKAGCGLTVWKDCCVKAGGPMLTAGLMARVLKEGRVRGSTGEIVWDKGTVAFTPANGRVTKL